MAKFKELKGAARDVADARRESKELAEGLRDAASVIVSAKVDESDIKATIESERAIFFSLATEELRQRIDQLERKVVEIISDNPLVGVQKYQPAWNVLSSTQIDGGMRFVLEQNPDYLPFEYELDDKVVKREITESVSFDAKRFWQEIDEAQWGGKYKGIIDIEETLTYTLDEEKAVELIDAYPELEAILEQYVVVKPTAKLVVRKAKKSE